ncbi:MAG: MFS transporter [Micrococcales bacterium]|nr:MFS transporter [Micrococcales bacterium]
MPRIGNSRLPGRTWVLLAAMTTALMASNGAYMMELLTALGGNTNWLVTGLVLANLLPPAVMSGAIGHLVDRMSSRVAWAGSGLLEALCWFGMGLVGATWWLVALAALRATISVAGRASAFKAIPEAAGLNEELAGSIQVGLFSVTGVIAPPLAAVLYVAAGQTWSFWLAAGVLSLAAIGVWVSSPAAQTVPAAISHWHEIWLGSKVVRSMTSIRRLAALVLLVAVSLAIEEVASVFYLKELAGAKGFAVLIGCWSLGLLIGVLSRRRHLPFVRAILLGAGVMCLAVLLVGVVPVALVIGPLFVIGGFGNSLFNLGLRDMVYQEAPKEQRAQAWALVTAVYAVAAALGNVMGTPGLLGAARTMVTWSGALGLAVTVATVAWMAAARRQR